MAVPGLPKLNPGLELANAFSVRTRRGTDVMVRSLYARCTKSKRSASSHESIDAVENISERSLVRQVDHPKITLLGIHTESGTMDHQHARSLQQIQYKLFIRTPTQHLRFD